MSFVGLANYISRSLTGGEGIAYGTKNYLIYRRWYRGLISTVSCLDTKILRIGEN